MQFSIIIPTYNYAHFLSRAIDSCISQEGEDWEIIVVDDGSTDNTKDILEPYIVQQSYPIRYIIQNNLGPAAARNTGIRYANGNYLLFLDADDALLPYSLLKFRHSLHSYNGIDFLFGGYITIDNENHIKKHFAKQLSNNRSVNFSRFLRKKMGDIATGTALFHKKIFNTLRFPENIRNNEDIVLIAQVFALYHCASFPDPVLLVHRHEKSQRHNIDNIRSAGLAVVDCLFDPAILPENLMRLRQEFVSRVFLSRFRSLYLDGKDDEAKNMYSQAIRENPKHLLLFSYLRKYLRLQYKSLKKKMTSSIRVGPKL